MKMSNQDVENAAIDFVLDRERARGRSALDARKLPAHGVDIVSTDHLGRRHLIEVKAYGGEARGGTLWLETAQVRAAQDYPDEFALYIVENVRQGDPEEFRLLELEGATWRELLLNRRERHYVEVPLPVAVFDKVTSAAEDHESRALAERQAAYREQGLRLIEGVLELHDRGDGRFRIWCEVAPTGLSWRLYVAPGNFPAAGPDSGWMQRSRAAGANFSAGPHQISDLEADLSFCGLPLSWSTTRAEIADAILSAFPADTAAVPDPLYRGWLMGLLLTCRQENTLPIGSDEDGWGATEVNQSEPLFRYPNPPEG